MLNKCFPDTEEAEYFVLQLVKKEKINLNLHVS